MKKTVLLCLSLALVLIAAMPVQALVVDAPHNTTNLISCATCHSYSLWWQYSPSEQSSNPDHTAIVDAICMTCHDGGHGLPLTQTHASSVVGTLSHGTWGVGCSGCHNPHSQEQLNWLDNGGNPYLVTGTIASLSYAAPPIDQTTITYSGATSNPDWPAEGAEASAPDWANKSVVTPDRGLILVHDTVSRSNSYAIVSATPSQVVVKGSLTAEAIDPNFIDPQTQVQNPPTCNTFGLIYGQLIKSTIAGKAVKFLDPNGGFVQAGTETTGICQVCHTQTSRYTVSGELPIAPDTHEGRDSGNCMECHLHASGIGRGTPHDTTSFPWAGNCALCHNPGGASVNVVATTHNNSCGLCHVDPAGGGPRTDGDPANGMDGSAIGAVSTSSCVDCHLTNVSLPSGTIHHTSASGYAAAGACSQCHDDSVGKLAASHELTIMTSANCGSCHAQAVGTAGGAPVDPTNAAIHDACTTCHQTNGQLKAAYGTASAMPLGGGACEACHGAYFTSHDHGASGGQVEHTVMIDPANDRKLDGSPCSDCHSVLSWSAILATHRGDCALCHAADRDINPLTATGTTVAMVISNANHTVVTCLACHQDQASSNPGVSDHSAAGLGLVLDTPFCVGCHPANDPMAVHYQQCALCHTTPPLLQDPALRPRVIAITPNAPCTGCHAPNYFIGAHGHDHSPTVTSTAQCVNCHGGDTISAVHQGGCFLCHSTVDGARIVGGNGYGDATANSGSGGTCIECHGAYFNGHTHDHASQVTRNVAVTPSTANCVGCHVATSSPFIDAGEVHAVKGCASCHGTSDGSLLPPAVAGGGECVSCHTTYFTGHQQHGASNHDVLMRPTDLADGMACNSCHRRGGINSSNPLFTNSWSGSEGILALHQDSACTLCHDSSRPVYLAPPFTSVRDVITNGTTVGCLTCHANTAFSHPPDPHDFVFEPSCETCHGMAGISTAAPKGEILPGIHGNQCSLCHSNGMPGTTFVGSAANATVGVKPHPCTECHSGGFDSHSHGSGNTHDVLMRATDLYAGLACNTCHRQGGSSSGNPLFTNSWSGSDGILGLHQNSCALCHGSTRTENIAPPYTSVNEVIMFGTNVSCLTCHADRVVHPDPHDFIWDGNCATCHPSDYGVDVHNAQCALCHVNPAGGGTRRAGVDGDATQAVSGQTASCLTCHAAATYPAGAIHHDTPNAVSANCTACHVPNLDHGGNHITAVAASPTCTVSSCHPAASIVGTATGVPVNAADNRVHDACSTCHNSNGTLRSPYGSVIDMPATGGVCEDCHGPYNHPNYVHDMPPVVLCVNCHAATTAPFVSSNDVHGPQGCATCHNLISGVLIGSAVGKSKGATCVDCHNGFTTHTHDHTPSVKANTATSPTTANCVGCHQATTPPFISTGQVHAQLNCSTCHSQTTGALIGSATGKTTGGECVTCHTTYFSGHQQHGVSNHDVQMRPWDQDNGAACNICHRRGGTFSANPLFTNSWSGMDGILALHQGSCPQCHDSSRTTGLVAGYASVAEIIMIKSTVGCLDCHANSHVNAHDFVWDGGCVNCHNSSDIGAVVHKNNCALCHVNPSGGGSLRTGTDGDATLATNGADGCLTCHPATTYPASWIHHDTQSAANNNCDSCHPSVDHGTVVQPLPTCTSCHMTTAGTASGMPVDLADSQIHDACRTCHTFNPITLAGELITPTGNRGVLAMPPAGGPCTACHATTIADLHHSGNSHALIGECEYCHQDPRNMPGGGIFQDTPPTEGIPTHLPCEECHVKPKRGATVNGWTAASGQMTIYAYSEGSTHSTTNYSVDFPRTTAHSGGHVIANTVSQINNWGICFSCHDGSHAIRVNQFHAKPTALLISNLSCGNSGTVRYAPGREARNTIGNFDFFASTFRPASTRPGGTGSCKQPSDWSGAIKYGSTNFPPIDTTIPDPWGTGSQVMPMFPVQTPNNTTTPAADNVKVSDATWNGANIVVTASNSNGCGALTAVYNGNVQSFTGTTTCTATFTSSVPYTPAWPTVDVTTSNAAGLGIIGYRIRTMVIY